MNPRSLRGRLAASRSPRTRAAALVLVACALGAGACRAPERRAPTEPTVPWPAPPRVAAAARPEPTEPDPRLTALLERPALGLDELLALAELASPELGAARHAVGSATGRTRQAGLYPNPTLALEAEDVPAHDVDVGEGEVSLALTQPLILGGRRSAGVAAARAEADALAAELEATRRAVLARVRALHQELVLLASGLELYDELLAAANETLRVADTRRSAGAAPDAEVLRARVEVRELEIGRARLERAREASAARLVAVLGVPLSVEQLADAGGPQLELPELDLADLRAALEVDQPTLSAARDEVDAADRRLELARAARIPDLSVRFAYGRDGAVDEDVLEAGLGIALPLFDRNQGRILEARHEAARARRRADLAAGHLAAELAAAHAEYASVRLEAQVLHAQVVPDAERALAQAREAYRAGRSEMVDVLDAQRTVSRARLALLEALRSGARARARLGAIVGVDGDPTRVSIPNPPSIPGSHRPFSIPSPHPPGGSPPDGAVAFEGADSAAETPEDLTPTRSTP